MKGSLFTLRSRHRLLKTLHNLRVTLLCGLLTFVVLRSTLGAGKFGTPAQDYDEIRHHLHRFKLRRQQKLLLSREQLTDIALREETFRTTLSLPTEKGAHVDNAIHGHAFDNRGFRQRYEQRQSSDHRPRILLVTSRSPSNIAAQFLLKFLKNKVDYCHLHGIEMFDYYSEAATGMLACTHVLQELMFAHPNVEWIWWMDSFTIFTDMSAPPACKRYAGYNVVVHGGWDARSGKDGVRYTWEKLWSGGNFLLRNCAWSHNYLENEGRMQGAAELFLDTKMETYEPGVRNSDKAWQPHVAHFASCSLCGKDDTDLACLTCMQRALRFVDDEQKAQVGSL